MFESWGAVGIVYDYSGVRCFDSDSLTYYFYLLFFAFLLFSGFSCPADKGNRGDSLAHNLTRVVPYFNFQFLYVLAMSDYADVDPPVALKAGIDGVDLSLGAARDGQDG